MPGSTFDYSKYIRYIAIDDSAVSEEQNIVEYDNVLFFRRHAIQSMYCMIRITRVNVFNSNT